MSQLIYIETSIPSFYYETRPQAQFRAMREWTREWWDTARLRDTLVTSEAVVEELERAPEPKRTDTLELLRPLPRLENVTEVDELVAVYLAHKIMPRDAKGDARHLALAAFQGVLFSPHGIAGTSPTRTSWSTSGAFIPCWAWRRRCSSRRMNFWRRRHDP